MNKRFVFAWYYCVCGKCLGKLHVENNFQLGVITDHENP